MPVGNSWPATQLLGRVDKNHVFFKSKKSDFFIKSDFFDFFIYCVKGGPKQVLIFNFN